MLWATSRQALTTLMGLAPLLVVEPARGVGEVVATDASDFAGGVSLAHPSSQAERERLYWDFAQYVYYKGRDDLASDAYTAELGGFVTGGNFDRGFGWAWRDRTPSIMVKEGHAFLVGFQRALSGRRGFDHRHLALVDNQALCFAIRKGTSRQPAVNAILRRCGALSLVTNSTLDVVWIRTTIQPADEASRRYYP